MFANVIPNEVDKSGKTKPKKAAERKKNKTMNYNTLNMLHEAEGNCRELQDCQYE